MNALVTGASRGIGKAICEKLVEENYFVYCTFNTGKKEADEIETQLKNVKFFKVVFSNRAEQ